MSFQPFKEEWLLSTIHIGVQEIIILLIALIIIFFLLRAMANENRKYIPMIDDNKTFWWLFFIGIVYNLIVFIGFKYVNTSLTFNTVP